MVMSYFNFIFLILDILTHTNLLLDLSNRRHWHNDNACAKEANAYLGI